MKSHSVSLDARHPEAKPFGAKNPVPNHSGVPDLNAQRPNVQYPNAEHSHASRLGPKNVVLALSGGITLASMIAINSYLATFSSPLLASWLAHGVGAITSLILVVTANLWHRTKLGLPIVAGVPFWAYLGGIPGAMTVILAAVTVNSPLGLSGTIALIMAGQVLFGLLSDAFGWFGLPKRAIKRQDATVLALIALGGMLILFGGNAQ
ncbi:DMT family transporter [Photobacterium sp. TY1-4]|uniref:DMT family transporter n=1 Tax=Photobacterium sp. TY1-4 TaxID=2899122 RepID=UPI0021BF8C92|nr:DMT family transporter [Photobacterium sp. TY1-4]UXI03112.1 DMT family transporter [Photobacterium sp. TY1-4]